MEKPGKSADDNGAGSPRAASDEALVQRVVLRDASPHALPPSLRERVLAALDSSPVSSAATTRTAGGAEEITPHVNGHADDAPVAASPARTGIDARWRRPRLLLALAAALLLAISLATSVWLGVALARERALRADYAALTEQQEVVLDVVDARDTVKRQLRATVAGSAAYGKLYTRPDLTTVVVMAARLPVAPPGKVYDLWVSEQGQIKLAGTVNVNAQGFGLLVFAEDHKDPAYDAAWLTVQPPGTTTPAGNSVIRWDAKAP